MHKRKFEFDDPYAAEDNKKEFKSEFGRGHTLDSDEEDVDADETYIKHSFLFTWSFEPTHRICGFY
jgi:hypothetical protein